jgi:hypothetical protein
MVGLAELCSRLRELSILSCAAALFTDVIMRGSLRGADPACVARGLEQCALSSEPSRRLRMLICCTRAAALSTADVLASASGRLAVGGLL